MDSKLLISTTFIIIIGLVSGIIIGNQFASHGLLQSTQTKSSPIFVLSTYSSTFLTTFTTTKTTTYTTTAPTCTTTYRTTTYNTTTKSTTSSTGSSTISTSAPTSLSTSTGFTTTIPQGKNVTITFNETGLPGINYPNYQYWCVSLSQYGNATNNTNPGGFAYAGQNIKFSIPEGQYGYTVYQDEPGVGYCGEVQLGYVASPVAGYLNLTHNSTFNIIFSEPKNLNGNLTLGYYQTTLPPYSKWYLRIFYSNGTLYKAFSNSSSPLIQAHIKPGFYVYQPYSYVYGNYTGIPYTINMSVNESLYSGQRSFTVYPQNYSLLIFNETGLPANRFWGIEGFQGATNPFEAHTFNYESNSRGGILATSDIAISVPSLTYSYLIQSCNSTTIYGYVTACQNPADYNATSDSGYLSLNDSVVPFAVNFKLASNPGKNVTLDIQEALLPTYTNWNTTLSNSTWKRNIASPDSPLIAYSVKPGYYTLMAEAKGYSSNPLYVYLNSNYTENLYNSSYFIENNQTTTSSATTIVTSTSTASKSTATTTYYTTRSTSSSSIGSSSTTRITLDTSTIHYIRTTIPTTAPPSQFGSTNPQGCSFFFIICWIPSSPS